MVGGGGGGGEVFLKRVKKNVKVKRVTNVNSHKRCDGEVEEDCL